MNAGDHVRITLTNSTETRGVLRHITGVSVVLEPRAGERRSRRVPWSTILELSRIAR